jgi:hypothetical protein
MHLDHRFASLCEKITLEGFGHADLQHHVERRAGLGISAVTIKKAAYSNRVWSLP